MTLKEFALLGGIVVSRCDKEWGGTWAYSTKDHPKATCCGYRNEVAAYKSWAQDTFGKAAANELFKLLKETP